MSPSQRPTPQPVAVDDLDRLVAGHHDSPHDVLGPHVRTTAASPSARCARWRSRSRSSRGDDVVADDARARGHLGRACSPRRTSPTTASRSSTTAGGTQTVRRPVPLPADPRRARPAPDQRGPARAAVERARRARPPLRRVATATVVGTSFAVWAPNAKGVRVAGDFNYWDGRAHPMRMLGSTGVWELFVPDVGKGAMYKYEVCGADGVWRQKADPLAMHTQVPPERASVVFESEYEWGDADWIDGAAAARPTERADEHLRGAPRLVAARTAATASSPTSWSTTSRDLGFTHVELLPVMEHPFGGSWGYQVSSYFAPTARFGDPDELRLLDRQAAPGRHRRDPRLGAGALPEGRLGAGPLRRHAAVRARRPGPRRAPRVGHLHLRLRPSARCATSWSPTRCTGSRSSTSTGCGSTRVASMLYLDYSREDGQWTPNIYGGRENLEAVVVPAGGQRDLLQAGARASSRSPRSRPPGRASPGRPTSAASASASSGTWAGCTTRSATWRTTRSTGSTTTTR